MRFTYISSTSCLSKVFSCFPAELGKVLASKLLLATIGNILLSGTKKILQSLTGRFQSLSLSLFLILEKCECEV